MKDGGETPLTKRERAVLELLATSRTYAEIADELRVSINTVQEVRRALVQEAGSDQSR